MKMLPQNLTYFISSLYSPYVELHLSCRLMEKIFHFTYFSGKIFHFTEKSII